MDEKPEQEYLEYDRQGRIWGNVPRERIRKIKFPRISNNIIEQFLLLDGLTSTISDVLDSLGRNGAVRDVKCEVVFAQAILSVSRFPTASANFSMVESLMSSA